ncbi:hypothetical protein OIV83_005474 [Microbotryomycetes sp. JL201]|nr:hypothetical protein OIV83_005474 [Microbotryomycetes sp. JL201]
MPPNSDAAGSGEPPPAGDSVEEQSIAAAAAAAASRASSNAGSPPAPTLPRPLGLFLAQFPHPCWAMRASALEAALVTRASSGIRFDPVLRGHDDASDAGDEAASYMDDQDDGSPADGASRPVRKAHSASGRTTTSTATTTNMSEILSKAFDPQEQRLYSAALTASLDDDHNDTATDGQARQRRLHPSHSRLLEGGSQRPHHPSRTAEGAISSMLEHKRKAAAHEAHNKVATTAGHSISADISSPPPPTKTNSKDGSGQGLDKWASTTSRQAGKGTSEATERSKMGMGLSLTQLLTPVFANDKWRELVGQITVADSATSKLEPLSFLQLCSTADLQALLDLITAVLTKSHKFQDDTVALNLKFPRVEQLKSETVQSPSVSSGSRTTSGIDADPGFNLQVVATLLEEQDLIVCTTISTHIFPTEMARASSAHVESASKSLRQQQRATSTAPMSSPNQKGDNTADELVSVSEEAVEDKDARWTPKEAQENEDNVPALGSAGRPRLEHRGASLSTTSSDRTVSRPVPSISSVFADMTLSNKDIPVDSPSDLTDIQLRKTVAAHARNAHQEASKAAQSASLPDDALPKPLPDYTGRPAPYRPNDNTERLLLSSSQAGMVDPKRDFVVERRKSRKKSHRASTVRADAGSDGRTTTRKERLGDVDEGDDLMSDGYSSASQDSDGDKVDGEARDQHSSAAVIGLDDDSAQTDVLESRDRAIEAKRWKDEQKDRQDQVRLLHKRHSDEQQLTQRDMENDDHQSSVEPDPSPTGSTVNEQALANDQVQLRVSTASRHRGSALSDPLPMTSSEQGHSRFLEIISRTPVGRQIAAFDWADTPLGNIRHWSPELKSAVMLCLATPFRSAIWWGDQQALIYNDEYARLLGSKHPGVLGAAGAVGWSEIWDTIGPLAARVMQGETVSYYDHHLPMIKNGFLEETYHIWAYIPFRNAEGVVVGYDNPSFETTARVVAERRLGTMRDLSTVTQLARTTKDFFGKALKVLEANEFDLPFVLMYGVETVEAGGGKRTAGDKLTGGRTTNVKLTLEGTVGVPSGHQSAPNECTVRIETTPPAPSAHYESDTSSTASYGGTSSSGNTGEGANSWPFQEALSSRKPVFIANLAGRNKGFVQRGWPSEVKNAVVIPLMVEGESSSAVPRACLIVGLNPRRPWNEVFATFLNLMARTLSMGLMNVTLAETEAKRTEELVQLDRAKTAFFANVSHELRTPLSLILGPLEDVISNKSLRREDKERLVTVQRHANRLLHMVNTLLDFSRLEGGRLEALYQPVKLGALTADLASLFRAAVERANIKLVVDVEEDPVDRPVYLAVDLYEKICFNLLGNAFKYTQAGSITVKVRFEPTQAIVQFIDTGCGIENKELDLIFDRFHRVESTSRVAGGTGIGLSLTLELVKAVGGTLTVESEIEPPNNGSTFTVHFLRGSEHLPQDQVVHDSVESVALPARAQSSLSVIEEAASWKVAPEVNQRLSRPSQSPGSSGTVSDDPFVLGADLMALKNSTILVVDDNSDLRQYISVLLRKAFNVVEATDGQEALDYALESPPSLIVSDVMMPRLDGNGLLKALRANPATALIPIIFLSAQAGQEARVEALLSGADDYLVKPFQGRELLARVNIHLQLGKMRIELERRVEERTRALIESEMRYRGLADRYSTLSLLSPVGIFMADVDGKVNYANPRFYDISGINQDSDVSEWMDAVHDGDRERVEKVWTEAVRFNPRQAKKDVTTMEFRWKPKDNWVLFEIRPFSEEGVQRGFVGSITDISQQKRVEALHIQEVERRAADAEENRRNTDQFLDMSSHELRNPLSGVWQNAQVIGDSLEKFVELLDDLVDGEVPDSDTLEALHGEMLENVEAVESIILCASHQQRIADDILNVSKLNMGLLSIQPVPFDVSAKVQEVVTMFSVECQQKAIKLALKRGSSLADLGAEWVVADPARISQITINFLSNGVKYTSESKRRSIAIHVDAFEKPPEPREGAMRVKYTVPAQSDSEMVWLSIGVEDSGKGLTKEELNKLFARFAQANPKSDQYGGSGLGLWISAKLVELHQGFIEVESTPGVGSMFRFVIPTQRAVKPANVGSKREGSAPGGRFVKSRPGSGNSGSTKPPAPSPPMTTTGVVKSATNLNPTHVLVVEDNLINQKVLVRQLKIAGYQISTADNGQQALDMIAQNTHVDDRSRYSVVLMDIEMPVMDGLTAIKELRKREKDGTISIRYPVIAVTGNARSQQKQECLAAGFDDIVAKPYDFQDLLARLSHLASDY